MDIRSKLYPYPVLSQDTDDYEESSFHTVIAPERDGYYLRIGCRSELVNDELVAMLADGKVKFAYHLECAQTGYRVAILTKELETVHLISENEISGRLQICSFIVACEDLPAYVNSSFHPDYRGFQFSIEAGCVMAVGNQVNIEIEQERRDLAHTPSVFSIIKSDDELAQGMMVEMTRKKIVIKLPEREFYNYKSLSNAVIVRPVLNALVIVPALAYVLAEVARRDATERYIYHSESWYIAIKKALAQRFACDIDSDQLADKNIIELAQKLVDVPISGALNVLADGYGSGNEEEEV